MLSQIICISVVLAVSTSEITVPGIDREVSDGVKSLGYNVVYGDEEMTVINQVVNKMETNVLKSRVNLNDAIPALPPQDVKCLMSVDQYCSKAMLEMKNILLQAIKEDCANCTQEEREKAGRVVASMLAHDHVAWKMFLTRSALQSVSPKETHKVAAVDYKTVGEPDEIVQTAYRYTKPGFKVRIKRYAAEKIPKL